jgi:hypothetical protein
VTKSGFFCYGNELKFTYEHLQFQNFFRLASDRHIREGRGKRKGGEAGRGVSHQTQKPNSAYQNEDDLIVDAILGVKKLEFLGTMYNST